MIKQIVKRDGRIEDFSPEKVNRWSEWASESLDGLVDWSSIVTHTVATLPAQCESQTLQERLIKTCLDHNSWSYYLMAGRLYAALLYKQIYDDHIPTVQTVHRRLQTAGLMEVLDYSDAEYAEINELIDHSRDLTAPHFSLHLVRQKYSLKNRVTGEEFETQQFTYMRMAMALAEVEPRETRLHEVKKYYDHLSEKRINAPTPNFVNLGTPLRGYASCCTYTTKDDAKSLAIGDHIAYMMTVMSAGIGAHVNTRSTGDPIRGGIIKHQGRLPYYRSLVAAVKANLQNGRGGAATTYYSAFDPEAEVISQLKNPMSTEDKKIRGMDYAFTNNKFFARKVALNEQVMTFNSFTAPDLWEAFYSKDDKLFEELYRKYEADPAFVKYLIDARQLALTVLNEGYETGRAYLCWIDEMNRHTPFKDRIFLSNLCTEIGLPTEGYTDMMDLYSTEDHGRGEIGLCSLGGIVVSNIKSDEEYFDAMYYTLKMIDRCIEMAEYALPHLGVTARARRSAGVGIMDLAHYVAARGLSYTTPEGKAELHRVAERHSYMAIKASLKLGKELGNAAWMHKTKWPEGWLPIDTYNRNVDKVVDNTLHYDWEALRAEVVANGGIRNSVLIAYMPGETSSKAAGVCNSLYPIRELTLVKTDGSTAVYWAAPNGEVLADKYESAWDIPSKDLIDCYAIFQKFTDQAISADLFRRIVRDDMVTTDEMIDDYLYMTKMGLKSRYYQNTLTSKQAAAAMEAAKVAALGHPLRRSEDSELAGVPREETPTSVVTDSGDDWVENDSTSNCTNGVCTL